jgi:GntR family transcriptional regulator
MAKTATAAYAPVVSALRDQINAGDLEPGAWLPSESALMAEHDVSRYSAREALKRLAAEGLISVVDGKGSHVRTRTARPSRSDTRALWLVPASTPSGKPSKSGKTRVVDAETHTGTTEPRDTGWQQADVDLALALGIPEHTPVFIAERLHTTPEGGRVRNRLYVPATTASRVPALKENPDRAPAELYAVLDKARLHPQWTETVRATPASTDDTTALGTAAGTVLLITRRTTNTPDGQALVMEETRRDATHAQLTYTLTPNEAPDAAITM